MQQPKAQKTNLDKTFKYLRQTLPDSLVEQDYWLGGHTTYRVGGNADIYVSLNSEADLESFVNLAPNLHLPILVFGMGSNLLIADSGFKGLAVSLGEYFAFINIDTEDVVAGGSAALPVVARQTAKVGLVGFEWAVGVPGSTGGAVYMNAGGHGSDIASHLEWAEVADFQKGKISKWRLSELKLGYRSSVISKHQMVTKVALNLKKGNQARAEAEISKIVKWRRENQPGGQNGGSVFKNTAVIPAGQLLDESGAKGMRVGSAWISEKHANFIQVEPNGKAEDIRQLILKAQALVLRKTGVHLEVENIMVNFE